MHSQNSGFLRTEPILSPRLLVQGSLPNSEYLDDPLMSKMGHWLKWNILRNSGIEESEFRFDLCKSKPKRGGTKKGVRPIYCANQDFLESSDNTPLLIVSDESAYERLGVESVATWHGHIEQRDGRMFGLTYGPASVMAQPNLLPLVIREIQNLQEAARNPALLKRPTVVKGIAPYKQGQEAVVDLEWDWDKKKGSGDVTVVGIAYEGSKSYSTYGVDDGFQTVRQHFEDGTRIIGHNFIDADLPRIGALPRTFGHAHIVDTMIVAHLIHPHWSELGLFGLEDLVRYYRPTTAWKHDKSDLLEYNGYDTAYNFRLWEDLQIDLTLTDQWHLVEKDQRLARMTSLMHKKGIRIDSDALRAFDTEWAARRAALRDTFPFNPNSGPQVKAFFESRKIKLANTQKETLIKKLKAMRVPDPMLQALVDYKDEGKGIKTWFSDEAIVLGRIFPKFNTTGTAVARFSSSGPNAQNIPPDYRHFILPDDPDSFIASFDGKNIEGRTCAWESQDELMLADFSSGLDIHTLMSSRIMSKRMEDVTKDERQGGKRTVHASNYLETPYSLAGRLYGKVTDENVRKAEKLQAGYFGAYPQLRQWQRDLQAQMSRGDIMLRNAFGRVRMVYAQDDHERAKRAAHFLGCSDGADVVNQRALDIEDALGIRPLLIVHDELAYSLPKGAEGERQVRQIREILDSPIPQMDGFVIPFGYKHGPNYGELHEEK